MFDLSTEKPARIEGALIEEIFYNTFIATSFKQYSMGWWFTKKEDQDQLVAIKFYHEHEEVSKTDQLVASSLLKHKKISNAILVTPDGRGYGWKPFDLNEQTLTRKELKEHLRPLPEKQTSKKNASSASNRTQLVMAELESRGLKKKIAIDRDFANRYLNRYSWDIDAFVLHENKLLAFEVKQKFPTGDGKFGLNVGLVNLFSILNDLAIPVWHIVLTKPIWDKDFPSINFLTEDHLASKAIWVGTQLDLNKLTTSETKYSPVHTSLKNDSAMSFKKIPCTDFCYLTGYQENDPQKIIGLIEGRCRKIISVSEIPKIEQ